MRGAGDFRVNEPEERNNRRLHFNYFLMKWKEGCEASVNAQYPSPGLGVTERGQKGVK